MNRIITKDHVWGGLLIASFLSVILAFSSLGCFGSMLNAKRSAWESRAKATLRSYGETELAYQNTNNARHWGTWDALIETDYLAQGYSKGNIIENYSLWTSVDNSSSYHDSGYNWNTFTVVAFPRKTSPPGYLSTFAIREDQTLRVYRPDIPFINAWGENGDFGTRTWEPIR